MQSHKFCIKYIFNLVTVAIILQSCTSTFEVASTKFHHANYFSNVRANVYLNDNSVHLGYLSLNISSDLNPLASLSFPKEKKTIELPINKIKAYEIDDVTYVLKTIEPFTSEIFLIGKPAPKQWFVKMLTPKNYTIQLFSSQEKVKDAKSSLPKNIEHNYVSFGMVNNEVLYDVSHPSFETHLNRMIQEIGAKNEAFYNKINNQKLVKNFGTKMLTEKVEVLKTIATLYQQSIS